MTRDKKRRMKVAMEDSPYKITRELNDRSLFKFMKTMWDTVSSEEFVPNWHIEYLCGELEKLAMRVAQGKEKKYDLIINVPPGTTKTITTCIMFPVWCWTKWPWMKFIMASYSSDLSWETAEYARDMIRSEYFQAIYPDIWIKEDKNTKGNYRIIYKEKVPGSNLYRRRVGGNRLSTSVGATATGFHAHIIIVDDPLNPEQAASEKELLKANRFMSQTLSNRKVDKAITPTILIMQRLHQDDPTGHWLAKAKKNLRHICFPGEIRHYGKMLKPEAVRKNYINDLLDPKRMPWSVMKDMEADLGQYGYAGQIGQDPSPPGGGMFQIDNLIITHQLPEGKHVVKKVRYWDKAGTEEGDSPYTVGCLIYQLVDMRWMIMDVKRGRWSTEVRERIIRSVAEADGQDVKIFIEQEPGSGGMESAQGTIKNLAGFATYADRPTGEKTQRADPYSVQINNGNFRMLRADWNFVFLEEHRLFPYSTYKDQVDAAAGAFNQLTKKRIARRIT
jgi:predicted phage terminase large subunit-like protein